MPITRVIVPLASRRPTGMAVAGAGLVEVLREAVGARASGTTRVFRWLNDAPLPGVLKMGLRLLACQLVPLWHPRTHLVFASHHAPLWRTGRHTVVVHDLISLHHPEQHPAQTWFFRRVVPRVLAVASRVVTISQTTRADLQRFLGIAPEAVAIVPSFAGDWPTVADDAGQERRGFLFVGARFRHKRLDLAVAAVLALPEGPDAHLEVFGLDRAVWPDLDFATLERGGRFTFRDYGSEAEKRHAYATRRCLLYPTTWEGQGLPPLEALAQDCPVLCSDLPALRETCGAAAGYLPAGDGPAWREALRAVAAGELDPAFAAQRAAAPARLQAFSRQSIATRWREALQVAGCPLSVSR